MDRMPLYINALDFSHLANKYGSRQGWLLKNGPNGGDMEDGSEVIDRRGVMTALAFPMNDMPSTELGSLLRVCLRDPYISVYFYDLKDEATRTSVFTAEISEAGVLLYDESGTVWLSGPVLTLREVNRTT